MMKSSIEARLQSQDPLDKNEVIEEIANMILQSDEIVFINSIGLKLADFFAREDTSNELR